MEITLEILELGTIRVFKIKCNNLVDKNMTCTFKSDILSIKETALDVEKEDDIRLHAAIHKQLFL